MSRFYLVAWLLLIVPAGPILAQEKPKPADTRLSVDGFKFTINDKPVFLLGISYYAGLGASEETLRKDLDEIQRHGFNWIRVWATWAAFDRDVSGVDADGKPRQEFLKKLQALVAECNRRGLVVDVTLSRGNGVTGPARLQSAEAQMRAVQTIVEALKAHPNWYLDLSNERNIKDKRFTDFADLKKLRQEVKKLDAKRLVTASHAGDISKDDLKEYLETVSVDFLSPHRPRNADSPKQTEAKTAEYLKWIKELKRQAPVHYQEPFRRGFQAKKGFEPAAEDFLLDLKQARDGGAGGWCFHNGDQRDQQDGQPRRSFDLREKTLFEQVDDEERKMLKEIRRQEGK